MRNRFPIFATTIFPLLAIAVAGSLQADETEPNSASDAKPKAVTVNGVLEAVSSAEVMADAEQIDSFVIKRIVPHGAEVTKGENLVWFDREAIDERIEDSEKDVRLARLALDQAIFDHDQFLKTQELDRAAAERERQAARQEYDNFVDVDRDRTAKSAAFNLKSARASLANAQEELKQLQQMYEEDDLTEESEEIVLKRAKQAVESAQFRFETTEIQSNRVLEQQIPRSVKEQESNLSRAELAYEKKMHDMRLERQKRDIELAKEREKLEKKEKDLAELKEDRKEMVLTSPISGIALHGKLTRGRLPEKPSTLDAESKVTDRQVLITVVNPQKLQVRVDLEEKQLGVVTEGSRCTIVVNAFPEFEASGVVKSVSKVPYAATKYDAIITLRTGKDAPGLIPTMTCELKFESPVQKDEAEEDEDHEVDAEDQERDQPATDPDQQDGEDLE
jgi:multidrug resistance efflux pump